MKWIKRFFFTLVILVILLLLGIGIFLMSFDLNHYRDFVATQLSETLGYPVKIQKLSTKISLVPTINVSSVLVLDKDGKTPLLQIPHVEAVLELAPLVYGEIAVQKINIPKATLTWKKQNKPQDTNSGVPAPSKKQSTKKVWIENIAINQLNGHIEYDKAYDFEVKNLKLKDLAKTSFDFVFAGQKVNVIANFGSVLELIKRRDLPVDLILKKDKDSCVIKGKIGNIEKLHNMRFQVGINVADLKQLFTNLKINVPVPELPFKTNLTLDGNVEKSNLNISSLTIGENDLSLEAQGTVKQLTKNPTVDLDTTLSIQNGKLSQFFNTRASQSEFHINLTKKSLTLSDITLIANKSDAKGKFAVDWANTPVSVQADLTSSYFNIYDIWNAPKKVSSNEAAKQERISFIPTEKLPYEWLNKINTDIKLSVSNLNFTKEFLDYVKVESSLLIKKGELDMPSKISLFGGLADNRVKINAAQKSVSFSSTISGIQLNKIKRLNQDIKDSVIYAKISLQGKGETLRDLAGSAQGKVEMELTHGQIINKWFNTLPNTLNMLRENTGSLSFSTQDQKTDLVCGAVNLNFRNGLAVSDNQIALETGILNFVVNGQINLKREMIDLTLLPLARYTKGNGTDLLNMTQSVHLVGPWNKLEVKVDTSKAVQNILKSLIQKPNGEENASVLAPKALCQKALGHAVIQPKKSYAAAQNKNEKQSTGTQKEQQNLKQKLLQSLSQALTNPQ